MNGTVSTEDVDILLSALEDLAYGADTKSASCGLKAGDALRRWHERYPVEFEG
jgi:hypothetical protein